MAQSEPPDAQRGFICITIRVICQKERHAYSVSFFLGFAGRGPAPPFGDSNARDGRAIPPPRFCLRQNARTPQKRRGPEGPLGKISRWQIENLKYLDCSALPQKRASAKQMPFFVDSAGCQPAPPFGIEMLGAAKTLVRRTRAAGQKAGWVQACPLAGNLKIFRYSGLSLKRARCESCPFVFPLETYCLLHY